MKDQQKNSGAKWTKHEEGRLAYLFENNVSIQEISRVLMRTELAIVLRLEIIGLVSVDFVDGWLSGAGRDALRKRAGRPSDKRVGSPEKNEAQDCDLVQKYKSGVTVKDLSEKTGVKAKNIIRYLKKYGDIELDYGEYFYDPENFSEFISGMKLQILESGKKETFIPISLDVNALDPESLRYADVISERLKNILINLQINDVRDLFFLDAQFLLDIPNFGRKTLGELNQLINDEFERIKVSNVTGEHENQSYRRNLSSRVQKLNKIVVHTASNLDGYADSSSPGEVQCLLDKVKSMKISICNIERDILKGFGKTLNALDDNKRWHFDGSTAQQILSLLDDCISLCLKDARSADVLRLSLGLNLDSHPMKLDDIAKIYNVSRERIRQIKVKSEKILINQLKRVDILCAWELRHVASQVFLGGDELPADLIISFCRKYYGNSVRQGEISFYLAIILKLFDSNKEAKRQIGLRYKMLQVTEEECFKEFARNERNFGKWARVFSRVIYPKEVKKYTPDTIGFSGKVREINQMSIGKVGTFFSQKCGRDIFYESNAEHKVYRIMEGVSKVVWYQEQPLSISYEYRGKAREYFPDLAVITDEGICVIVEVKQPMGMVEVFSLVKAIAAINFLAEKGIGYLITDESGISLSDLMSQHVDERVAYNVVNAVEENKELSFEQYKSVIDIQNVTTTDLMAIIVQNDLSFSRAPWRLAKLPEEISFKKLVANTV